ncbi:signal peptide-containing protein [Cryptosporidium canis]|nr:signal peptide-containing protein [Cryptosporidium canis]
MVRTASFLLVLGLCCLYASGEHQERSSQTDYVGYVAPSLEVFMREYAAFGRPVNEFELDQKLLVLLENPDCWYNQRGRKVILLFNETNFPEEYAILRKSSRLFGTGGRLESSFLVLEEEEEREQYMNYYDQVVGKYDDSESAEADKGRYSYLDSYSERKVPVIDSLMAEDAEKEKYKSRIKRLIGMKEGVLAKISQVSLEIRNLEASFMMQCEFPECNICSDFQSHLNSKYMELNRQKRRYRMIISLLREFVDHSGRFDFEISFGRCGGEGSLRSGMNDTEGWDRLKGGRAGSRGSRRPGFEIAGETSRVDREARYRELKRLLDESERELDKHREDLASSGDQKAGESGFTECTSEQLEELAAENEKLALLIRSVKFFVESIFENSCPRCNNDSLHGTTRFGDILDTQIRVLRYYRQEKVKVEDYIQSCKYYLENKAIELDDDVSQPKEKPYRYLSGGEFNRKLGKIFERYREYGRNSVHFERLRRGGSRSWERRYRANICDVNSSILVSELSKEVMSRIVASEIQKRVYLGRRACRQCSRNSCSRCSDNSDKLKALERNIRAQTRLFKSISAYLELCGFEQSMRHVGSGEMSKTDTDIIGYFGRDGVLWSVEKYLSLQFINRVLRLKRELSPFVRAKILERIKYTLQAYLKVLKLSSLSIDGSECRSCKYRECNDCYFRHKTRSEDRSLIASYSRVLSLVDSELHKYFGEMRRTGPSPRQGLGAGGHARESILIRENSLREWLPGRPELVLACSRENYSEAFSLYNQVLAKRRDLQKESEYIYNSIISQSNQFSEYHFSNQVREWESLWRERIYYDEVFSYINGYLSSCVKANRELNSHFHNDLYKRSEVRGMYKEFQRRSEMINCLIERLRELHSSGCIECYNVSSAGCGSQFSSSDEILERLNAEFQAFRLLRKGLNSYIYSKQLGYYDNKRISEDEHLSDFGWDPSRGMDTDLGGARQRRTLKEDRLDRVLVEYQKIISSPIPGMSKYLHESGPKREDEESAFQLTPESEYQCSKTEILVLQRIVSLLSQNQGRLSLLQSLNSLGCKIQGCHVCSWRSKIQVSLEKELSVLIKVLSTATEQLNQCLLDSRENLVSKEDVINFQNSLLKLLKTESTFNVELKSYMETIKDFECRGKDLQTILNTREDKSIKVYLWIQETLTRIQTLTDEDPQIADEYVNWVHQVTQLLDFSKAMEERLQECINAMSLYRDHGVWPEEE